MAERHHDLQVFKCCERIYHSSFFYMDPPPRPMSDFAITKLAVKGSALYTAGRKVQRLELRDNDGLKISAKD